jgi:hypothetical protein
MKTTGKKMVHSSYPTQKMFAEGTGSKHVDSNTVVERPLLRVTVVTVKQLDFVPLLFGCYG